ncbi:hypothetical protein CAFE_22020 [Caprobacter fermentans]|uniref:DUF3298 and DUF4163 domain-containing protein n=1 Tax=Caproicibacter fermentans TaxID=2576756 RepID=A0A6N8I069_9FIRM|nr:DUF3298 and DUF4163 domain-containing protein [Caproicibacter fermentans]MVB11486.1 hypothetical protein [Caproicibacter fermentans]OCN02319.1 hypothetical protein A7X67_06655 [Clostridium sp. W14A]QNK41002.1 DUF3298 and DUF4163 domain-containing protein [Caproicibacter fermentans]
MNLPNSSAEVTFQENNREFSYRGTVVLTLAAQYPEIRLRENPNAQARINSRFRQQGAEFSRYAAATLYRQAVRDYHSAQEHDYPFRTYDAVMKYEITLNQDCYLSSYRDRYEFTGGAHGNTIRASDTFSLKSGRRFSLSHFFAPGQNYRRVVASKILRQAEENMRQNPGIYFDDYKHLILKYFNPENYYLTPDGVTIYYQQYEIAPYASGIVTFMIPYDSLGIVLSCLGRVPQF